MEWIDKYLLYVRIAIVIVALSFVSFTTYKVTVWKESSENAAQLADIVAEKTTLQQELLTKQSRLDLYAANTQFVAEQAIQNEKRIKALNVALSKAQKNVSTIRASDCSSALKEIMSVDN